MCTPYITPLRTTPSFLVFLSPPPPYCRPRQLLGTLAAITKLSPPTNYQLLPSWLSKRKKGRAGRKKRKKPVPWSYYWTPRPTTYSVFSAFPRRPCACPPAVHYSVMPACVRSNCTDCTEQARNANLGEPYFAYPAVLCRFFQRRLTIPRYSVIGVTVIASGERSSLEGAGHPIYPPSACPTTP